MTELRERSIQNIKNLFDPLGHWCMKTFIYSFPPSLIGGDMQPISTFVAVYVVR